MIITRSIVNKDILFHDYQLDIFQSIDQSYMKENYSYSSITTRIDFYKNFLMDLGCKPGETVLIGYEPGFDQISLFFAVCELGLSFIVNDYKLFEKFDDFDFIDTKTEMLLPINYFFDDERLIDPKRDFLGKISNRHIKYKDLAKCNNYKKNNSIMAKADSVLMKCTSSGTTGTPKLVEHTHEFLYNISKRNSKFFDNHVAMMYNLNHGSSLATYFIPALMSSNVKEFSNVTDGMLRLAGWKDDNLRKILNSILQKSNHLMIPYSDQLYYMLQNYDLKNTIYYTLSTISQKIYNLKMSCKDIISIFGCNETSGPLLINKASYDNFKPDVYYKLDNYYDFVSTNPLIVNLVEYNKDINTKDEFVILDDGGFKFNGRSDLIRINGYPVQMEKYQNIIDLDGILVYDTVYNEIYLAIWDTETLDEFDNVYRLYNKQLAKLSEDKHNISKVKVLYKRNFYTGVKLDQELIRSYFRKKVKNYDKI